MHRRRDVGLARPQAHGARRNLLCRVPSPTASLHCGSDLRGLDALASLDGPARHPLPRPDRSGTPVAIRVLAPPHRTAQLHHGLQICAASALAAASMCRSLFVAAFPLFAKRMYTVVGDQLGLQLPGDGGRAVDHLSVLVHQIWYFPLISELRAGCIWLTKSLGDAVRRRSRFHGFLQEEGYV